MTYQRWVAGLVLFLQLPVPLYWFVLHPQISFWRRHQMAAYFAGVLLAWPPVAILLVVVRHELFLTDAPPVWRIVLGFGLIVFEGWMFWRAKSDLGTAMLVGKTELSGGCEVVSMGIYAHIRNPRYVGSFVAILGACFPAGQAF